MSSRRASVLGPALSLSLLFGTLPAAAAEKTMSVATLQTIVAGLGLTDTGDKKTVVSVDGQGKEGVSVTFFPVDDGKFVLLYTNFGEIPANRLAALPAEKMLAYNDDHSFYFSVGGETEKTVYLAARLDAATITPQLLRQRIDDLLEDVDETKALWDAESWPATGATPAAATPAAAPASAKSYDALVAEADAAWEATPLAFRKVVFATQSVDSFGTDTPRAGNVFKTGESIHLYAEPMYYNWKPVAPDKFGIAVDVDLLITTKTGTPVTDKKDALKLLAEPSAKIKTVYMNLDVKLNDSLAATDYILTLTAHDRNGQKTATATMPFSIAR